MFSWLPYYKVFPFALVILDTSAGIIYALSLDWRRSIYWFAAAVLTTCVTF